MWAIARDGAVFYRGSVSQQNPAGKNAELGLVYHRCTFVHFKAVIYPHPPPPQENAGTTSRPPLDRHSGSSRWAGLLSSLWMKTVSSSSETFSTPASVKRSWVRFGSLQGTCGTDRASPPATPRVPPGSSSPTMSPKCLWARWTRSKQRTLAYVSRWGGTGNDATVVCRCGWWRRASRASPPRRPEPSATDWGWDPCSPGASPGTTGSG